MKRKQGELRIIAGKWRGRKIPFEQTDVRPTPNRVRETLFNWLMPYIHNADCLDMFAGSGALGFEALSRGAASVVMVDQSRDVIQTLKKNVQLLETDAITLINTEVPEELVIPDQQFDIVFIDPPYEKGLVEICGEWLEENQLLKPNALIYIEAEQSLSPLPIPEHWQVLKSKTAGQVGYHLLQRASG